MNFFVYFYFLKLSCDLLTVFLKYNFFSATINMSCQGHMLQLSEWFVSSLEPTMKGWILVHKTPNDRKSTTTGTSINRIVFKLELIYLWKKKTWAKPILCPSPSTPEEAWMDKMSLVSPNERPPTYYEFQTDKLAYEETEKASSNDFLLSWARIFPGCCCC